MIKKLLKLEFLKNFGYSNFWVIVSLWAVLYILVVFIVSQINIGLPGIEAKTYMQFPSIWTTSTWIASWFNLLLAILIIVTVGNEFSFRTFRSQVICGLSRNELIIGKGLFILFLAFVSMIFVMIVTLVFGAIFTTFGSETSILARVHYLLVYFIQATAYMSIGMMIAIIIKNTALSIVAFILYFFPMEAIIRSPFPDAVKQFFPVKIISNLTPLPDVLQGMSKIQMTSTVNGQVMQAAPPIPDLPLYTNVIVAIVFIGIFFLVSSLIVNKRNL